MECTGRRHEACIDAGDGAAVGFFLSVHRLVGRPVGQGLERLGHVDVQAAEGELAAQLVHFLKIEAQRAGALHAQGLPQNLGRDEWVAVTVTADPAADAQEGRHLGIAPAGIERRQRLLERCVEARQLS